MRDDPQLANPVDDAPYADERPIDEKILTAEPNAALQAAFAELPPHRQHLLAMPFRDPPCSKFSVSSPGGGHGA